MPYQMPLQSEAKPLQRIYTLLRGVDFSSSPSKVSLSRSPDAKNVYKDYNSNLGQAIETRPGIEILGTLSGVVTDQIYGIHIYEGATVEVFIHIETKLYKWDTFPSAIEDSGDITDMGVTMKAAFSKSFMFNDNLSQKLYIIDGEHYYVYDGSTVAAVVGYIPTTSRGAAYNGANRESYQAVNFISDYRKNTFVGDGANATFTFDVSSYDNEAPTAKVNGAAATVVSFDYAHGTATLSAVPAAPTTAGESNVEFTLKVTTTDAEKITKCTLAKVFDNKVFLSGNDSYKGVLFHSGLDDPTYFPGDRWYDDGVDNVAVKSILSASEVMIVIKDDKNSGVKVFCHTKGYDSVNGDVYPTSETEIHLGALSEGINFKDAIVYLTKQGLKRIYFSDKYTELKDTSSLVDTKLVNETDFKDAKLEVWKNYLCVLVNGKLYLADSKQITAYEYEWYYWDNIGVVVDGVLSKAVYIKEYDGVLYFGTADGHLCRLNGTSDDSIVEGVNTPALIDSYWTTPMDVFNSLTHLKTTKKRGGVVQVKRIPNSVFKVDVSTDKESWYNILTEYTEGFNFTNLLNFLLGVEGYEGISFGTSAQGFYVFKVKKRKIKYFSMKFYSDEIGKPFGLYEATIEFIIDNYVKG